MRVLFASSRGTGHFTPLVPFAEACDRAGHDVLVCGPPALEDAVAGTDFGFWRVDPPPPDELDSVWSEVPSLSSDEANVVVIRDIFGRLNTTAGLSLMRDAVTGWEPDVVVREPNEYASALAAEMNGVPHARVAIGLASNEAMALDLVAPAIAPLRADLGLPPDDGMDMLRDAPYLTTFPASLEDPDVAAQPRTLRFSDPAWAVAAPPADEPPLVYLTLGSQAAGFPPSAQVYRALVEAVAELPVRAVLTVGREMDPEALGPVPEHVFVASWVPQQQILASASAVVCHGGSGSTLGALAAGVPIVVVPLFADQPMNAARVEAVGAGLSVPPEASAIRAALSRVLEEPSFGEAARRVAAEMHAQPPVDAALGTLVPAA